jgi:hypothetical protein
LFKILLIKMTSIVTGTAFSVFCRVWFFYASTSSSRVISSRTAPADSAVEKGRWELEYFGKTERNFLAFGSVFSACLIKSIQIDKETFL